MNLIKELSKAIEFNIELKDTEAEKFFERYTVEDHEYKWDRAKTRHAFKRYISETNNVLACSLAAAAGDSTGSRRQLAW